MDHRKSILSFIGIALGAGALLLALVHFWAGPLSPQPPVEKSVAEKAVAIRDATLAALRGEDAPAPEPPRASYDLDRIASLATAVLGGLAVILAVVGYALKEQPRVAGGAAVLGIAALAYQFALLALGVFLIVALVSAVLNGFDFSDLS